MSITVRLEQPADWQRVEAVVEEAFGRREEALLVSRLRACDGVRSLVAVEERMVIGHAMFSPVASQRAGAVHAACGLAPLSVARQWQRRGVGSKLIERGLDDLRRDRIGLVVVLGHPAYYHRFGFVPAASLGLCCKWGGEDGAFQALELARGAADEYQGMVEYLPVFDETAW